MEGISHEAASLAGTLGLAKLIGVLRRQRHLDRRRDEGLVHRRHAGALRGVRLARDRPTSTATTSTRSTRRSRTRIASQRPADAHLLQDDHRQGRAAQGGHRRSARRGARRKGSRGHARGARLDVSAVRDSRGDLRRVERARCAAPRPRTRGRSASPPIAPRIPTSRPNSRAACTASCPPRGARPRARSRPPEREGRDHRHAQGVAAGDRGAREGAARAPRRRGRPDRLGVHQLVGQQAGESRRRRQLRQLRRARVRDDARSPTASRCTAAIIPYVGTFLTFSDYARNALRMAALMKLRSIFVFTHDSIGLGEDGPTHQSIEHAASLRLIPHMDVWRPCDTVETAVAWAAAIERADGPTCLLFTRQNVAFEPRDDAQIAVDPPRRLCARRLERHAARRACSSSPPAPRSARDGRARRARRGRHRCACRVDAVHAASSTGRTPTIARACCRRAFRASPSRRRDRRLAQVRRRGRRPSRGAVIGIDRFGESAPAACCSSTSASPSRTWSRRRSAWSRERGMAANGRPRR